MCIGLQVLNVPSWGNYTLKKIHKELLSSGSHDFSLRFQASGKPSERGLIKKKGLNPVRDFGCEDTLDTPRVRFVSSHFLL